MKRVPDMSLSHAHDFFEALRTRAQPFRFMDLPTELRYDIIRCAFQESHHPTRFIHLNGRSRRDVIVDHPPRLTLVNNEFPTQALQQYFGRSHFIVRSEKWGLIGRESPSLSSHGFVFGSDKTMDAVLRWTRCYGPEHLRWLTHVSIELPYSAVSLSIRERHWKPISEDSQLHLRYSIKDGLTFDGNRCLIEDSGITICEHVAAVGKTAG